jgi:hypothetical protein
VAFVKGLLYEPQTSRINAEMAERRVIGQETRHITVLAPGSQLAARMHVIFLKDSRLRQVQNPAIARHHLHRKYLPISTTHKELVWNDGT